MQLGTFGAILRFALEMETQALGFYERAVQQGPEDVFLELARRSRKRLKRLERARREGVQEMILESITGLDGAAYHLEVDLEAEALQQAVALEARAARFYHQAASKMPIRGVARLLQRMAAESEQWKTQLEGRVESDQ